MSLQVSSMRDEKSHLLCWIKKENARCLFFIFMNNYKQWKENVLFRYERIYPSDINVSSQYTFSIVFCCLFIICCTNNMYMIILFIFFSSRLVHAWFATLYFVLFFVTHFKVANETTIFVPIKATCKLFWSSC